MIDGLYAIDYQVHSYRSHDGRASIREQCERAIAIGLNEIGFSEHKDFDPEDPVVDYFQFEEYMLEISEARIQFGDALRIRAGVEIDYQVWFEDKIGNYLNSHPFDFVIGSVHYVDREMIMTPGYNRTRGKRDAYADYFRAVQDSAASGLFDIIGHLEYANRRGIAAWGKYDPADYRDELDALFDTMIERAVAIEINSAGLHHGLAITYPTAETLAYYVQRGGTLLSIGSDAHHPDQLGHAYGTAAGMAISAGIKELCTWASRRIRQVSL